MKKEVVKKGNVWEVGTKAKKELKKERFGDRKVKVSQHFVMALAVVSILGFAGIISQTLFNLELEFYIEALWMSVIGIGLLIESKIKKLKSLERGITSNNLTHLITVIIGILAIVAGILSFPQIRVENPGFLALKGIMGIIAVIVIVVQVWIIDH